MKVLVLQHAEVQHLGLLRRIMEAKGVASNLVKLYANEPIPDATGYDGLIILGGPMNAYEEQTYPYLAREDRVIKAVVANGVPFLGIGLGGQLLAKALGARVYRNEVREIGFYSLSLTEEGARDRLFKSLGRVFTMFEWHGDTFDIPEGAVRIARSSTCENQAFRYGQNAYALLAHLQMTPAMVALWCEEYYDELKTLHLTSRIPSLVQEAYRRADRLEAQAKAIFTNFLALIEEAKGRDRIQAKEESKV